MPPVKIIGQIPDTRDIAELLAFLVCDQLGQKVKKVEVYKHEKVS